MSILNRLFKRSVRASLSEMYSETDVIQMAVCVKLFNSYKADLSQDDAATLAAAVANKLFGRQSPDHSEELLKKAGELAEEVLRSDDEARNAAVMACRARLLFVADNNTDEKWVMWDTIEWMSKICDLCPG